MGTDKDRIIDIFHRKIKGRRVNVIGFNPNHDGREGHWLERQFDINPNASNSADLFGYELKNQTSSKTTFGDWSANYYIFMDPQYSHIFEGYNKAKRQIKFLEIFGKPNVGKGGRLSWSGEPCPKISAFNTYGQKLIVTDAHDILAIYDYKEDKRTIKSMIVPIEFRDGPITLARWFGRYSPSSRRSDKCLKSKLEDKFNDQGWFTCKKDTSGVYNKICFGPPINFELWIELVKSGVVFFDSGMYEGNFRPYSQWRMINRDWDALIIDCYE